MDRALSLLPILPALSQSIVAAIEYARDLARVATLVTVALGTWQMAAAILARRFALAPCSAVRNSSQGAAR